MALCSNRSTELLINVKLIQPTAVNPVAIKPCRVLLVLDC